MKITITINTDNAAFKDDRDAEVQRIITAFLDRFGLVNGPLYDINGNKVGEVQCKN